MIARASGLRRWPRVPQQGAVRRDSTHSTARSVAFGTMDALPVPDAIGHVLYTLVRPAPEGAGFLAEAL